MHQRVKEKKLKKIRKTILIILIIMLLYVAYHFGGIERRIYTYFYPQKYEDLVYEYSAQLGIDPMLTFAIIKTESNFEEKTQSKSGAIGLMQLMESTAKEQAKKLNIPYQKELLYDPEMNLKLGLTYFNTLLDYFEQHYILAFASYNAGLGNVQKWIKEGTIQKDGSDIENIPFRETNMYVRKIIKNYEIYKGLYI